MLERPNPPSAHDSDRSGSPPREVSIVIPARNEEANIGACLHSLTTQTGVAFEIIVVDDDSSDRTSEIARSFPGVKIIRRTPEIATRPVAQRATGKNRALIQGVTEARADWILFTDADTMHLQGSLRRSLDEAEKEDADLLSYSPEQTVVTFAERAVMPVIFSELAAQYPLHQVRDENSNVVAANGQYILVRRTAYEAVGGHAAVATEILEDVALAQRFRSAGFRVYFRYGGDAVRTRMYRGWQELREGWTKNLVLLFPNSNQISAGSLVLWSFAWSSFIVALSGIKAKQPLRLIAAGLWLYVYRRIRTAHFSRLNSLIALAFGPPIFAYLLMRSSKAHQRGEIMWKGRAYVGSKREPEGGRNASKRRELRAEN